MKIKPRCLKQKIKFPVYLKLQEFLFIKKLLKENNNTWRIEESAIDRVDPRSHCRASGLPHIWTKIEAGHNQVKPIVRGLPTRCDLREPQSESQKCPQVKTVNL